MYMYIIFHVRNLLYLPSIMYCSDIVSLMIASGGHVTFSLMPQLAVKFAGSSIACTSMAPSKNVASIDPMGRSPASTADSRPAGVKTSSPISVALSVSSRSTTHEAHRALSPSAAQIWTRQLSCPEQSSQYSPK